MCGAGADGEGEDVGDGVAAEGAPVFVAETCCRFTDAYQNTFPMTWSTFEPSGGQYGPAKWGYTENEYNED